jgi:regulator of protease activity HflC (stomatin/prohibitin superfamily)
MSKEKKIEITPWSIARMVLIGISVALFLMATVATTLIGIVILVFAFLVFTTVGEAKGKVVTRLRGFKKVIIIWEGHGLDKNWNVVKGGTKRFIGGLCLVGIWPIDQILKYKKRYQTLHIVKDKDESQVVFREEEFEDIPLQPTTYVTIVKDVETRPPERLRVTVTFLFTYEITNIYKALFKASISFHEKAKENLDTVLVSWITQKDADGLLTAQRDPTTLWDEVQQDPVIAMLRDEWGMHILEKTGIRIQDIQFPPEYQAALALKKKTTLEAEAAKKRMEIEAQARASETVGTLIEMIHQQTGMSVSTIRKEFKKDPKDFLEKHKEVLEKNLDLLYRKLAIEGRSFVDIRVQGAQGGLEGIIGQLERAAIEFLAAKERMPEGKPSREGGEESKKSTKKTEEEEESQNSEDVDGAKRKKRKAIPEKDIGKHYTKHKKQ